MKASELVELLRKAIATHGDLEVYSTADWEVVRHVEEEPMAHDDKLYIEIA